MSEGGETMTFFFLRNVIISCNEEVIRMLRLLTILALVAVTIFLIWACTYPLAIIGISFLAGIIGAAVFLFVIVSDEESN